MKTSSRRPNDNDPSNPPSSNRPSSFIMPSLRPTTSATSKRPPPAPKIRFINAAHPDESNSAQSLSQIRSHAARQVHAQRRQRNAAAHKGVGAGAGAGSSSSYSILGSTKHIPDAVDTAIVAFEIGYPSSATGPADGDAGPEEYHRRWEDRGLRRLAPKMRETVQEVLARVQNPRQMIGDTRRDACQSAFAWNPSDEEYRMFDYYNEWVILYGYKGCIPESMMPAYLKAMKTIYVPFAMTHTCLLSAMLFVASQRCSADTNDPEEAKKHELKSLYYKLKCIQLMKQAISKEGVADDATIALGMIMSAESYREEDKLSSDFHGQATLKMVRGRGGLRSLAALSGLLQYLLSTSLYNPNYGWVSGPSTY